MDAGDRGFSIGEPVHWSSASRGEWRHHSGIVVGVVPAGAPPFEHIPPGARWAWCCSDKATRPHESYLVALKDGTHGTVGKLHRPRVRHLQRAGEDRIVLIGSSGRVSAKGNSPGYASPAQWADQYLPIVYVPPVPAKGSAWRVVAGAAVALIGIVAWESLIYNLWILFK